MLSLLQIALLLRSLGVLPAPPPRAEVVWVQPGREGYYLLPREAAATASRLMRKGSGGSQRRMRRTRSSGGAAAVDEECEEGGGGEGEAPPAAMQCRRTSSIGIGPTQEQELQQGGTSAAVAAAAEEKAEARVAGAEADVPAAPAWLQCDLCSKWRRLPPGREVRLAPPAGLRHGRGARLPAAPEAVLV